MSELNSIPAEFRPKDANGKLLAFGTETCSIFPAANLAAR